MRVILLHGLRMNRHVMLYLARCLARHGFDADTWGYPSAAYELDHNAALLGQRLGLERAPRIALVAHSYGGVVVLRQLARQADARVHRVVLLGSPIGGSAAGAQVTRHAPGRWFLGRSRHVWDEGPRLAVPAGVEVGSIAGVRQLGLGRYFTRFDEPNDGVVSVTETRLPGLKDHLVMPIAHSLMLASPQVARQVEHFLRRGAFAR